MIEDKLMGMKAAFAAVCSAMASFLGWQGIMALVWVAAMGLDYLSGSAAACKAGKWSSAEARTGLWHKGGMILVVCVAAISDAIMAVMCSHLPLQMDCTPSAYPPARRCSRSWTAFCVWRTEK